MFGSAAPPLASCPAIAPIAPAPGSAAGAPPAAGLVGTPPAAGLVGTPPAAGFCSGAVTDFCNSCNIRCLPFLSSLSMFALT